MNTAEAWKYRDSLKGIGGKRGQKGTTMNFHC